MQVTSSRLDEIILEHSREQRPRKKTNGKGRPVSSSMAMDRSKFKSQSMMKLPQNNSHRLASDTKQRRLQGVVSEENDSQEESFDVL